MTMTCCDATNYQQLTDALTRARTIASRATARHCAHPSATSLRIARTAQHSHAPARRSRLHGPVRRSGGRTCTSDEHGHQAMGVTHRQVPWRYLCEGLPPVYTAHLASQVLAAMEAAA